MTNSRIIKKGKYLKESPKRKITSKFAVLAGAAGLLSVVLIIVIFGLQNRSIYKTIAQKGYTGTQEQWLASLVGEEAASGTAETAYELAVKNGYRGSEAEWVQTLVGHAVDDIDASPYTLACENGFEGSLAQWLTEIADEPEKLGLSNEESPKTEYELACKYGYSGTFIEWLVSVTLDRVFHE